MITLLLLACSPRALEGAAAKGPYILGSSVSVSELDGGGDPTGQVWNTETANDLGAFSLDGVSAGPLRVEVSGYHFDEVRGALSSSALTLRATGELDASGTIYVNTVTHLASQRVLRLLEEGATMAEATAQAEDELRAALAISPDGFDPGASGVEMTLLDGDTDAAAWLLAVGAVFVQAAVDEAASEGEVDATLQELLNRSATDLADDGALEAGRATVIARALQALSSEEVQTNLGSRFTGLGFGGAVPDLRRALDRDRDGRSDAEDDDADGDGEPSLDAGGNDCYDEDPAVLGCGPTGEATLDQVSVQTLGGGDEYFDAPLQALGDADGDGLVDFVVGMDGALGFFTAGDPTTPAVRVSALHGDWTTALPVGDTDGDGIGEVSVGQSSWGGTRGRALVTPYPLGSVDPDLLDGPWFYGFDAEDRLTGVWGLGDTDGDGLDDVAVLVDNDDTWCDWCGSVRIFRGPLPEEPDLDEADAVLEPGDVPVEFTMSLQTDLDGDGLGDLLVSDLYHAEEDDYVGGVFLFQGGLSESQTLADADAALVGSVGGSEASLLGMGDYDGDDHPDLALSPLIYARATESDPRVATFRGPFSGTRTMAEGDGKLVLSSFVELEINSAADRLDADGDGADDLWVGGRFEVTGTDKGRAYLFYQPLEGSRDLSAPDASLVGTSESEYLGQRLAAPGDLNGDGRGDLLVWSQPHRVGQVDVVLGGVW